MPLLLALLGLFAFAAPASAQGRAVSCGCYCGVVLSPPCSDDACKTACGYGGGSSGYSEPPMQGVKVGTWTRHFARKHSEHMQNCGKNPLCMLMGTAATAIVMPIGLVVDLPVFLFKGLGYAAVGTGRGLKAVGRGVAAPFKAKPKPVQIITEGPPPQKPGCAGMIPRQDAALAELETDAESLNAAIVQSQSDQGVEAAKDAALEAVPLAGKADAAVSAHDFAVFLRDFHRDTRRCVTAGGGVDSFRACMDSVNKAYGETLSKLIAGARVEAARAALTAYAQKVVEKTLPLVEKAAACSAR